MKKEMIASVVLVLIVIVVFFVFNGSNPSGEIVGNSQTDEKIKEFDIIGKQWQFSPRNIEVNKGDTVILNVKSIDVAHGIVIPDLGINEYIAPEQEIKIEFIADREGTFYFACSVSCGMGHSGMRGA